MDPISPLSLVGRTMGARKRRAWEDAIRRTLDTHRDRRNFQAEYAATRKLHRVGERLRPCPGCCACKGGATVWFCGRFLHEEGIRITSADWHEQHCTDGVLPAKRAVPRVP